MRAKLTSPAFGKSFMKRLGNSKDVKELGTQKTIVILVVGIVLLSSIAFLASAQSPLESLDAEKNFFSVIQISDTQFLSANYPDLFTNLTNWISSNKEKYNIQMVMHTGDIVDNPADQLQWEQASSSMGVLLESGLPYCWNAGNHDKQFGDPENLWLGNNYTAFNIETLREKNYWLSDLNGGKNTATQFSFGNTNYLIINLEYNPDQNVLGWMSSVLNSHNNSRAIVATHSYIDQKGEYSTENEIRLKNTLDQFSNVFLVLSGHVHPNGVARTRVENREEILFDRQDVDNKQGAAAARIMTFNAQTSTVNVTTYLAYGKGGFLNDSANQFSFRINLQEPHKPDSESTDFMLLAFLALVLLAVLVLLILKKIRPNTKRV
jgi:hypothetical protein